MWGGNNIQKYVLVEVNESFKIFFLRCDLWQVTDSHWVSISLSQDKRKVYWNNLLEPLWVLNENVHLEWMKVGGGIR